MLYIGVDVGDEKVSDVTIDTSTTSSDIEVAIDDTNLAAASIDALLVVKEKLELIEQALIERGYVH
ncbi:MAG: hypothetical protein ACPGQD_01005 [Planctomycetota bacterium]